MQDENKLHKNLPEIARQLYVDASHVVSVFTINHAPSPGSTSAIISSLFELVVKTVKDYKENKPTVLSTPAAIIASLKSEQEKVSVRPISLFKPKSTQANAPRPTVTQNKTSP